MATLFPPGIRIFDANGNPLSGAKIRVRNANTTDLVSLFSDSGLSSSITNPVITDAAGYPANGGNECAIHVASGTYDVAFLDSSDNVLANWDDAAPWGSESSDIERTLTGNGRIKITGAAGAVLIQAGDASPDNSGGTLTIEGWAGTQLDSLTLDASSSNFTGNVTVKDGKKLPGVVQTAATTFTAVSSVDIELVNNPTGVRAWRVDLFDMTTTETAGNALNARLSYDGGSTYKSGASDYYYVGVLTIAASATPSGSTGAAQIALVNSFETASNHPGVITLEIVTPNSGNDATIIRTQAEFTDPGAAGAPAMWRGFARGLGSYGRATHIRILAASGQTITGKYRVQPLYGFGE